MKADIQKRKVLHIIDSFGTGGAETWLLACAKYLKGHPELNFHFDFLASGGKTGVYDSEINEQGCTIFYLKYSLRNFIGFRKGFRKILQENKYDAIHNHNDFISGWHFFAGLGCLPTVRISHVHNPWNFVHNYVTNPSRWFSFRLGRILTVFFATKITGTSNAVMDEYGYDRWPFKKKRAQPAYCGFETERFLFEENAKSKLCCEHGWQQDCRIALFAGRIGLHQYDKAKNQKNPSFAFDVAKELIKNNHNWNFIFAGFKGVQGEAMEQEVQDAGYSNRIKFLGLRRDMPSLMSASDVLILPSLWEGLGMVAVEAQAAGLPVLVSDSVPGEIVIAKELIHFKSLSAGSSEWADEIAAVPVAKMTERVTYNHTVQHSPFAIKNSVENLMRLYTE